ncbi:MAG: type II toxin-antitoxin system VapC family toxin [Actinomycetota bacterium]|nr:type II toxin-antitoxin system VapC family toxin [Actinomycetota bacterium]
MRYLDTSLIVTAFANEQSTLAAQGTRLREANDEPLLISEWVLTETSAALSSKVRARRLSARERGDGAAFSVMVDATFVVLAVTSADFRSAAELAQDPATGLRAGDALHLAVASAAGATAYTLDRAMMTAGSRLQIPAGFAGPGGGRP